MFAEVKRFVKGVLELLSGFTSVSVGCLVRKALRFKSGGSLHIFGGISVADGFAMVSFVM